MPGVFGESDAGGALLKSSPAFVEKAVYPIPHGLPPPIARLSISWARGNSLYVSVFKSDSDRNSRDVDVDVDDVDVGGKVLELKLSGGDAEFSDSQLRRIAYGSVSPFALLQSRRNAVSTFSKMLSGSMPYHAERLKYVMEYSKEISGILSNPNTVPSLIEDPKEVVKKVEEPTCLKAAWELVRMFYADKQQGWLPERLVDWLADNDCLLSTMHSTVHSKLVGFQEELVSLQVIEDNPKYWDVMFSALALGWLEIVVKMLHLHGSYQLDKLSNRETENGLVEAVVVLISKMPRMRPDFERGRLGECFETKPDFIKAWEKWQAQITKLDYSGFWSQCAHNQTRSGLRNMLQIMLGKADTLSAITCNWVELFIAQLLYIRPLTKGVESMYILAQRCIQLKPAASSHKLNALMIGILEENTEVVLAECYRGFGPWMTAHAIEILVAGSDQAESILHEERHNLGEISIEELHRLIYAQVLCSNALTWQIAPIYLTSCRKQGLGFLEILLHKQSIQHNQMLLKNIEMCRLYELDDVCSNIMKMAGVYHWKHGRKGCGVFWLQQAKDEFRLNKISQQLFDSVGKSISDESFKEWEGLIELLGSDPNTTGGLEFLHKYRDFKRLLKQVHDGKKGEAARNAVENLISIMKNPSTPHRFWLPILHDSLVLLNWEDGPLLNVSQTNLLLQRLQEVSMARLRPEFVEAKLPAQALNSIRLALATSLGRAILEE